MEIISHFNFSCTNLIKTNFNLMPQEIEYKFLVTGDDYKGLSLPVLYRQGYLSSTPERVVRVREAGGKGYLTIKGANRGATRSEFEYEIPLVEAQELLLLCEQPIIEKLRYFVAYKGFTWEIDEFSGENAGLVIAEIELPAEDTPFEKPHWIGEEVTHDARYYNSNLIKNPYRHWK
jgi:adenylate cyclase